MVLVKTRGIAGIPCGLCRAITRTFPRLHRHCLRLAVPPDVAEDMVARASLLRGESKHSSIDNVGLRSGMSDRGSRFALFLLEVSYMLYWRQQHLNNRYNLYCMADSSPQKGYDFLNSGYMAIRQDQCVELHNVVRELSHSQEMTAEYQGELFRKLADGIHWHSQPCSVLGQGATSGQHKLAAWAFSCFLETGDSLEAFCDNIVSWTTDMGTELMFADFKAGPIRRLLSYLDAPELDLHEDLGASEDLCLPQGMWVGSQGDVLSKSRPTWPGHRTLGRPALALLSSAKPQPSAAPPHRSAVLRPWASQPSLVRACAARPPPNSSYWVPASLHMPPCATKHGLHRNLLEAAWGFCARCRRRLARNVCGSAAVIVNEHGWLQKA